jgi:hypothetical protein
MIEKTSAAFKKDLANLTGAWKVVEDAKIIPMLEDDDLTLSRLAAKPGMTMALARKLLDIKVAEGKLVRVLCRNPAGGGHPIAYRKPG